MSEGLSIGWMFAQQIKNGAGLAEPGAMLGGMQRMARPQQRCTKKDGRRQPVPAQVQRARRGRGASLALWKVPQAGAEGEEDRGGKATKKRFNTSEKGKVCRKRFNTSEKGKVCRKRFNTSEKGKARGSGSTPARRARRARSGPTPARRARRARSGPTPARRARRARSGPRPARRARRAEAARPARRARRSEAPERSARATGPELAQDGQGRAPRPAVLSRARPL